MEADLGTYIRLEKLVFIRIEVKGRRAGFDLPVSKKISIKGSFLSLSLFIPMFKMQKKKVFYVRVYGSTVIVNYFKRNPLTYKT